MAIDSVIVIKFFSALLYPVGVISVMLLVACVLSLFKRRLLVRTSMVFALSVFLLSSNIGIANKLVLSLESQYPQKTMQTLPKHDAIVVLGGGLRMPTAPAQHVQLGSASDRYWYAVQLYRAGKARKIIVSGGNIVPQAGLESEAFYVKQLLVRWGMPERDIILEGQSRTTSENQRYIEPLLQSNRIESFFLVTSAIHMPRAYVLFKQMNYQITPASADVLVRQDESTVHGLGWLPSSHAISLTTRALHEYYGLFYVRVFGS